MPWLHESDPLADEVVASLAALPAAARHDAIDAALARPTRPQDQVWAALLAQAVAVPAWVAGEPAGGSGTGMGIGWSFSIATPMMMLVKGA